MEKEISKYFLNDLVQIVCDYHFDFKNKMNNVLLEFEEKIVCVIQNNTEEFEDYCAEYEEGPVYQNSGCEVCSTFQQIKKLEPKCYNRHIKRLNRIIYEGKLNNYLYLQPLNEYCVGYERYERNFKVNYLKFDPKKFN